MNILFLNASPRSNGYTSQSLKAIEEHISGEHQIRWVRVNDLNVKPCQGCLKCRPKGDCVLPQDDGHETAELIRHADALIIGSPTYFGNITGPLRTLTDRCLTAFEEIAASGLAFPSPLHQGQKAALVAACNSPSPVSSLPSQGAGALAAMKIVLDAGGYELVGSLLVDGAAGRNHLPEDIVEKAKVIAELITGE